MYTSMDKYSKENIRAARSIASTIALFGGPNICHLDDIELVDRIFQLVGSLSMAVKKSGVSADTATKAFTLMAKAMKL